MVNKENFNILFMSSYDSVSLGIRTLQAIVKEEGYNTSLIFFKESRLNRYNQPTQKEKELLINQIKKLKPKIIFMSLSSLISSIVIEINFLIKKEFPNVLVIWGGPHPTICPEECIKHVDFVCIGEGERSILEFIHKVEQNKPVDKIKNFWVKKTGKIIKNDLRPLIQNLDDIPFFDYSSNNKYFIEDDKLIRKDPILDWSKYSIMASRGCPFNCSYCSSGYLHKLILGKGKFIRRRSVDNVIKELVCAKKKFKNLKLITFYDEVFVLDVAWLKEFAKEYKEKINLDFTCEFFPTTVKEEVIKLLKNIGLTEITMGIQSGSERVRREVFNRFTSDKQIINAAKIFKKYKITPHYDIILDNPYETRRDMQQSIRMLLHIPRPYNLHVYSLVNFPKTDLTNKLIKDGLISRDNASKARNQWRMSLKFKRSNDDLFYNCLVSLLSKNFVPIWLIKSFLKISFLRQHPKLLVMFTELCNKIKLVFTGINLIFKGKVSYSTFKYYYKNSKGLIN